MTRTGAVTALAPAPCDLRSEAVPRNIHSVTCNLSWPLAPSWAALAGWPWGS
eukprot:COSAG06_NODE_41486_length_391_cov_0.537671_2_plen_51_part_01